MSEEQLTTEQRQELYTLMGQWSRNTDLQFQKVAEWTDKQLAQVCEQRDAELLKLQLAAKLKPSQRESEALQRANAAELALHSRDKRISELGADICNMNDSIAEIVCQDLADWDWKTCVERTKNVQAALQAKERELREIAAALQCTDEFDEHSDVVTRAREVVSELAQARQQVIAQTIPIIERHKHYVEDCDCLEVMLDEIRSLTPPPALTVAKEAK